MALAPVKSLTRGVTPPEEATHKISVRRVTSGFSRVDGEYLIMTTRSESSSQDWAKQVAHLEQQIAVLTAKVTWYKDHFRLAAQQKYRASQEGSDAQQLQLFNEAEQEAARHWGLRPWRLSPMTERKSPRVNATRLRTSASALDRPAADRSWRGFYGGYERNALSFSPKVPLGEAITYCLNQWTPLTAFLRDGRLELDNNRALSAT